MRQASRDGRHLWGIDFVRFGSALLVAAFHLTWLKMTVAWYGWIGVQIFFVISGFVIARSANDTTPIRFVRSRVLRLYPGAWACAAIGLIVAGFVHHDTPELSQRFLNSFVLSPVGPFLAGSYWTLPVEIAFYAVIFVVLLAGMFQSLERIAVWLCIASSCYLLAYALQRAGLFETPNLEFGYDWKNVTLLRHGIYFSIGIFIWLWSERRLSPIGWAAFLLGILAAPLEMTCRAAELLPLMPVRLPISSVWFVPVAIWCVALLAIIWSARWEGALGQRSGRFLVVARQAGLATYPLYLLHEQFGEAARNTLLHVGVSFLVAVGVAVLLTTLAAVLVATFAEPALRNVLRGWLDSLGDAAEGVPWLSRLFRHGGVI